MKYRSPSAFVAEQGATRCLDGWTDAGHKAALGCALEPKWLNSLQSWLSEHGLHNRATYIGESEIAPNMPIGQAFVVEA